MTVLRPQKGLPRMVKITVLNISFFLPTAAFTAQPPPPPQSCQFASKGYNAVITTNVPVKE
jgi:hypothetical protein